MSLTGVNLLKAEDPRKCQTLFLSQISQNALQRALFPLGDMLKKDVKELARKAGLERIASRKEVRLKSLFVKSETSYSAITLFTNQAIFLKNSIFIQRQKKISFILYFRVWEYVL